jgi:hypothetical protein
MGNSQTKKQESIEARHSVPLGLYPKCTWDSKTLKKLIAEKKLAPIFKGVEDPDSDDLDECPICMLVCINLFVFTAISKRFQKKRTNNGLTLCVVMCLV